MQAIVKNPFIAFTMSDKIIKQKMQIEKATTVWQWNLA